jgi:Flp pilus assembly protein TadG
MKSGLARRLGSFLKGESGAITVEFSLWVPLLLGVMFLAINASMLFAAQSNYWNISRDTARVVSRHAMSVAEAEAYARNRARVSAYTPDVDVQVDDHLGTVTVTITADMRSLMPFDVTSFALGRTMSVEVTQMLEPI